MTDKIKNPIDQLDWAKYEIPDKWDWKAKLPMWSWHTLTFEKYPGWDIIDGNPPFVLLTIKRGAEDIESHSIASQFDSEATGLFYFRDWTSNGIPFCNDGDFYGSGFWFQKMVDAEKFHLEHGGAASWKDDFKKKQAEARKVVGR
jgi:hypothetical protein